MFGVSTWFETNNEMILTFDKILNINKKKSFQKIKEKTLNFLIFCYFKNNNWDFRKT